MNAGQICLAPDYVYVPKERLRDFVDASEKSVAKMFPTLLDNADYTSVINQRHFDRINGYVEQAREHGVEVVEINPANEDFGQQPHNKIAPTLVINPADDLDVMKEEIFGPVMPVKSYDELDETLDYINQNPRPLGLYYFGSDAKEGKPRADTNHLWGGYGQRCGDARGAGRLAIWWSGPIWDGVLSWRGWLQKRSAMRRRFSPRLN